uniref:Mobilization protein n=1 Tax=Streptococcus ferus TaxID=1345 RepID=Q54159_9STRE|nr:mobilization protein [Streptococcus ferus]
MSKTVSELAQELGVSRQYLNRILSQNNLGRKKGNKKVVSDMDEKVLISILEGNIGNQKTETKTETKTLVSNMSLSSSEIREEDHIGNRKMETKLETELETSFRYVREQLKIKEKEVEQLHQLLDQSQQLLLNEQKKNQLLLEMKAELADWEKEKTELEKQVSVYQTSLSEANRRANSNYDYAENVERWLWIAGITAGIFFVIVLVLIWIHFF